MKYPDGTKVFGKSNNDSEKYYTDEVLTKIDEYDSTKFIRTRRRIEDTRFGKRKGTDYSCIKITEGKFKDVIYHYGRVAFAKVITSDGRLPMKFDYTVDRNPNDLDLVTIKSL